MNGIGKRKRRGKIVSGRTAVIVLAILTIASTAGWIFTEIIPGDIGLKEEVYRERWGDFKFSLIERFRLHDPFHSFWYRSVLAVFTITLLLCNLTGWKGYLTRSFRFSTPSGVRKPPAGKPYIEMSWSEPARAEPERGDILTEHLRKYAGKIKIEPEKLLFIYSGISSYLSGKGYAVRDSIDEGKIFFSALSGRWHYPGNMIFHIGILVIAIGGMLGSFKGSREMAYGRKGDVIPLRRTDNSVKVEDFTIMQTPRGDVSQYVTDLTLLDSGGDSTGSARVRVNHPVSYSGLDIYQSSYYMEEGEIAWARITCRNEGEAGKETVVIEPGGSAKLPKRGWIINLVDFKPDFRMGSRGAYTASDRMLNPALLLKVEGPFGSRTGWLFLKHPSFSSDFDLPVKFTVEHLEPVYYTGLQISSSPGAESIITGIVMCAVGLFMMFTWRYRLIRGMLDSEGIIIVGAGEGGDAYLKERGDAVRRDILDIFRKSVAEDPEGGN